MIFIHTKKISFFHVIIISSSNSNSICVFVCLFESGKSFCLFPKPNTALKPGCFFCELLLTKDRVILHNQSVDGQINSFLASSGNKVTCRLQITV